MNSVATKLLTNEKRFVILLLICLAALQFTAQMGVLTKGVEYIVSWLTIDDTYYYLQTAWNTKLFGFPTFDGIHSTNGVQLLWFWLVVLIAVIMPSKTALLLATLATCFLLNALCYLIIWKLGEMLRRPMLSLGMASLWALLSFGSNAYSIGLENSLHAFLFWCVVWQSITFLIRLRKDECPNWLGLTVVLILNVWTRLDAALFSGILYIYCIVQVFISPSLTVSTRQKIQSVAGFSILAVLGLVVQLVAFRLMGGTFLPVSALIKLSWGAWGPGAWRTFATLGTPPILHGLPVGSIGLGALIVTGIQLIRPRNQGQESMALRDVWYCLLVASFLQLIAISSVEANFIWYQSPFFIFWIITFSVIADKTRDVIVKKGFQTISWTVLASTWLLLIAISGIQFTRRLARNSASAGHALYITRYNASLWMAENLATDAVCGSWNAGQLGFFSERTVINLDGLINDADYYNHVLQGSVSLVDYVYENEMDYIVDHNGTMVPPDFPVIKRFPINDAGIAISVWRVPLPADQ
jgi:hypothetical protein